MQSGYCPRCGSRLYTYDLEIAKKYGCCDGCTPNQKQKEEYAKRKGLIA
jgi:hypothetical protein